MKIAVTSQNFRTVTGHAGKARRFLIYQPGSDGLPVESLRLDLPKEMSMHEFHSGGAHPLDDMDVVITGSCGAGFAQRLARRGVRVVVTGGSNAEPELLTTLTKGYPNATIMNLYGLSETSGAVVLSP